MNAFDTVRTLTNVPVEMSVMLKGNHGIGKSQIVKKVADDLGIPMIDFRLSQNDVGDIKGIPFQRNGRTVFSPPEFMPITEKDANELKELLGLAEDVSMGRFGDKGILFLDEINRASREVQQAAFELVLDRRLNLRSLPEGWRVVTAINDNDDLYTVGSLDPAFVSRFMVIDFNPTYEEWMDWARGVDVHDSVTTFLTKHPELLDPNKDMIDENNKEGVKKLFDRRSWHRFSDTIKSFEKNDMSLLKDKSAKSMAYLTQVAAGFLGMTCALKFKGFVESDYESLSAEVILNKWDKDIAKKLEAIVTAGRIPELAAYNDLIIEHLKKVGRLNKKSVVNISKFVALMPKEVVSGFWQSFNLDLRTLSEEWYNNDPKNAQLILAAIVNPEALASN
jgi:hypothetical protein